MASEGLRVYVGAGQDAPDWTSRGWLCNDLPEAAAIYGSIGLIGPCWVLSVPDGSVSEIMARGVLEHLTYHEVTWAFAEWRRALAPGGHVDVEVPDVIEYLREYERITREGTPCPKEWSDCYPGEPEDHVVCSGADRWLRRAICGWQRYPGDEHRSAWTEPLFRHYLGKYLSPAFEVRRMAISFDEDDPGARVRHLWARARREAS